MVDDAITLETDRGENAIQSKETDEKENKVETSINIGSIGKANNENATKTPSNPISLPYNGIQKSDFGPLSPVQLNVGSNPGNYERVQQKTSVRSRQEKIQQVVGTARKDKSIERKTKEDCTIEEFIPDEKYVYEEGVSLMGELAIFANAEEEKQLKKMITDDQNKNTSNKTILDQSKKLVGFLGGSIRTAIQQNFETDVGRETKSRHMVETVARDSESVEASSEDPSLQRLNNFVGDLIGKLGSKNLTLANDGVMMHLAFFENNAPNNQLRNEEPQSVENLEPPEEEITGESINGEEDEEINSVDINLEKNKSKSPISQPKTKYWETLVLRSEEPKDTRYEYWESPDPSSLNIKDDKNYSDGKVEDAPKFRKSETPDVDQKKIENGPSPQSINSIPMDYSPGDSALGNKTSPRGESIRSREENSPGSLMFKMISAATSIETPLLYKNGLSTTGNNSTLELSPAISDFANMLSSAAAAQTPDFSVLIRNEPTDLKPMLSDFKNALAESTVSPTHDAEPKTKQILIYGDTPPVGKEKNDLKTTKNAISNNIDDTLLDRTPVKSNKTEVFRSGDSDSSLESDCDQSEDCSIYTSLSYQSSIQSSTPRSRRVMEWLDPNAPNTVSWPIPSMTTKLRSSETPERQLPVTKYDEKSKTMGTGQYLTLQKPIRSNLKSAQKSDRRLHYSTSPASLPSLLGSTSCNEVSDLESPNIINFPLNFKFSDEESTINSQSVLGSNEVHSLTDIENRLRLASPQSLMTVTTQPQEAKKVYYIPGNDNGLHTASPQSLMTVATPTVGYPTDEECSYKSKSPKDVTNRNQSTSRTVPFSIPTSKGGNSPHSTHTNDSFKHYVKNDTLFGYSKCLRRCIIFGMIVALVGSVTVLVIAFSTPEKNTPSNAGSETNSNEEWKIDIWQKTSRPTSGTSPPVQIASPSFSPTSTSTSEPTIIELSPTRSPDIVLNPASLSPTSSPKSQLRPTTSKVSLKPTAKLTSQPMSIPTFSSEEIKDLTWHRIINGENIWRNSDQKPVWFLVADNTPGIKLKVVNAARDDRFSEQLQIVIDDYGRSKAVSSLKVTTVPYEILCAPPEIGEIKVCSGDFGYDTEWIGSTILFMRDAFIVSALIRINESSSLPTSDSQLQYELCHQLGHSLGIIHNDADLGLSSCMKDFGKDAIVDDFTIRTNQKLQHPNSDDLDYLVKLYGPAPSRMLRGR